MNVRTGSSSIFPVTAVFAGLTVVLVSCVLPSQAGNDQKSTLSNNGTAICPNGWIPAVAPSRDDVTPRKLCVRVKEQLLTWNRARQDCRASRGFLIKLDTVLRVDNVALDEYLKTRGLDRVWTGMHHEHGTLMWDELQPHMVKAYYGKAQASGWKKRDWQFNFDSFKLNADTCGKLEVHNEDSSEISDRLVANRTRRSPQRSLDNTGVESLRDRLQKRPRTGLDNEEVAPSRSPVEDKKADILQNSLSQGLQEGLSDAAWDTNTGDTNTAGKYDTSIGAKKAPGRTTARSINFTDQPNPEDVDDNLRSTRRSSQRPYTKYPVTSAKTVSGNSTMRWRNTTQTHNNTTSLPMVSSQTAMTPRSSTSVDDLLNRLLKSSLDSSPNSDPSSVDISPNSERLDPALAAGNDSLERPVVDSSLFVDSQSANKDTSDDLASGKSSHNSSLTVDTTDTSDPHLAASHKSSLSVDITDTSDPNSAASHNNSLSVDITDTSDPNSAASHNSSLSVDITDTSDPNSAASRNSSLSVDTADTSDPNSAASHKSSLSVDTTDTSDPQSAASHNNSLSVDTTDTSDPKFAASHNSSFSVDTTDTSDPNSADSHNISLSVDTTDTSDSHSAASHNGLSINVTSFFKTTTTSADAATETPNIIHDRVKTKTQNRISAKTNTAASASVTSTTTTNHTGRFRDKSTILGQFSAIKSNGSLAKESHNIKASFRNSPKPKTARSHVKGFIGNLLSKRYTTTKPVIAMTTPRKSTSTGLITMSTAKTTMPTSTTETEVKFAATQNSITPNFVRKNSTFFNGSLLSSTLPTTTRNIPFNTTTDTPTFTGTKTTKVSPVTFTISQNDKTMKHITSSFKGPPGKVISKRSTPNIPVITTTDMPASTPATSRLSASQNDVTRNSAPYNAESFRSRVLPKEFKPNIPILTTTDMSSTTPATNSLSTLSANQGNVTRISPQTTAESFSGKVLPKESTTTAVPTMTTSDPTMSIVAPTTSHASFSPNKVLTSRSSMQHDFDSSRGEPASNRSTTVNNNPDMTTDPHLSTDEASQSHLNATANQDFITTKSAPILLQHSPGKSISKRSTTNIPVMTTTDVPTSTVATTTPTTSFRTQPSIATSPLPPIQAVVHNSSALNTSNTASSINAAHAQVSTDTPVFIPTAETASSTVLATSHATLRADNTTTGTLVSTLYATETPSLTNASTNTSSLLTGVTNKTLSTFNPETPRTNDSNEVTDRTNSTQYNSTATAEPGTGKTAPVTDPGSNGVGLDSSSSSSESVDLDIKDSLNKTRNGSSNNPGLDSSSSTSSEVSDMAGNITSILKQSLSNASGNGEKTNSTSGKFTSAKEGAATDKKGSSQGDSTAKASKDASGGPGGSSLSKNEPSRDTPVHVPSNTVSLSSCQEEHVSVCVTEAVEELSLVGHCDRNWYGHRLLDRCYKPVDFMLKAIEARQDCLRYSASLATVDTGFYGNITALLLSYFAAGSKVWVDASLNLDVPGDGQCAALEDGQLHIVDCNLRLPFICQKDVRFVAPYLDDAMDAKRPMTYVQNLTSFHPQTLWCPLRMSAFDDVILWFKDGRPVVNQDDDDATSFRPANGNMPNRLDIALSILEQLGEGGARIPKPAMLQGVYWCEIFRREPFNRVVSHKIFLKFTDVITLYGHVTTEPANHVTAAIFNRMGHVIGLPALMERRLATLNKNITHFMRRAYPIVRDIITFIHRTNPDTGRSEFTTYVCLATGDLGSRVRGSLVDLYISAFYDALVKAEDELRSEWNLTLPIRQALAITMSDMCPEANLVDRNTGLSATFPSTTVNTLASSRDMCNGAPTGNAFCKGDLQSGAYWDVWKVANPCHKFIQQTLPNQPDSLGTHSSFGPHKSDGTKGNRAGSDDEFGEKKPARPDLVDLDQVAVNRDNLADVSDRLADVANQAGHLSATDIEIIAQVFHRIVSVDTLTSEISDSLVTTANLILDASESELRKAEEKSNAPSRLLADLETFGAKAEMGLDNWLRKVTPNVAMEMWDLRDSSDVVIGFGARQAFSWAAPLSEPRIQTIKDRMWAEQHLSSFDVAIQLPESLVKNTVQYSQSSLRLTMFIYRKTGLFVGSRGPDTGRGAVNSAIISASLGGRKISGLEDKVRLVFKPFQEPRDGHKSTQCVFWDTELNGSSKWSSAGCVYNGTINGRTVCLCDHLTNFAILTDFYGDRVPISKADETALTVLTIIGLILSIIGLAVTIITFLAFKKLRQGRAQQTLFNMSIALLCFQSTFLIGVKQTAVMPVCLAVSVLLHYFILVSFAWMLIEAVLQYLTFVKVLGTYVSRYTLKTVIPAWGLPLFPVIAVLATDYRLYLGRAHYCWMDLQAYYYAFALPVGIIIVFNAIMFFIIIISLATKPKGLRSNQSNTSTRKTSLKAAIIIFVLLGLTWIFGYLAIEDARLPFQYAFTILSSLQGFLIFLLMVARRKQVRDQWEMMCCHRWNRRQNKQKKLSPTFSNSTTCSSSNSQSLSSFTNDSTILSSSTGSRKKASLRI